MIATAAIAALFTACTAAGGFTAVRLLAWVIRKDGQP